MIQVLQTKDNLFDSILSSEIKERRTVKTRADNLQNSFQILNNMCEELKREREKEKAVGRTQEYLETLYLLKD